MTETFGNVTLEAMACGLPVVAAGATGASSLVADGETGRLLPLIGKKGAEKPCSEALAEAIAPYCTDDELRRAHGTAGEKRSLDYSWEAINQVVADTYIRLVEDRRALQEAEASIGAGAAAKLTG